MEWMNTFERKLYYLQDYEFTIHGIFLRKWKNHETRRSLWISAAIYWYLVTQCACNIASANEVLLCSNEQPSFAQWTPDCAEVQRRYLIRPKASKLGKLLVYVPTLTVSDSEWTGASQQFINNNSSRQRRNLSMHRNISNLTFRLCRRRLRSRARTYEVRNKHQREDKVYTLYQYLWPPYRINHSSCQMRPTLLLLHITHRIYITHTHRSDARKQTLVSMGFFPAL